MYIFLGILFLIIVIVFLIFKSKKNNTNDYKIINILIYDTGINPLDIKLINQIKGKYILRELLILKWYSVREIFDILYNEQIKKDECVKIINEIDNFFPKKFSKEFLGINSKEIHKRFALYFKLIGNDKIELLKNIGKNSDIEVYDILSLFETGKLDGDISIDPIKILHLNSYLIQFLDGQMSIIKNLINNPEKIKL